MAVGETAPVVEAQAGVVAKARVASVAVEVLLALAAATTVVAVNQVVAVGESVCHKALLEGSLAVEMVVAGVTVRVASEVGAMAAAWVKVTAEAEWVVEVMVLVVEARVVVVLTEVEK